jgi:hypothetical protein
MGGAQTGQMNFPEGAEAAMKAATAEAAASSSSSAAAAATTASTALKEKLFAQPFASGCNSSTKFEAAREWLKENGGATVVRDALRAEGFVEGDTLTLGVKPFNVFARMASGAMPNPADQSLLGKFSDEFTIHHNRPENDADWEDEAKAATASMAGADPPAAGERGGRGLPGHVFISCKDMRWDRFNVLVMGMEGTPTRKGDAGVLGDDAWQHAWQFLQRLEAAAEHYVAARG